MRSLVLSPLMLALTVGSVMGQRLPTRPTRFQYAGATDIRSVRVPAQVAPEPGIHSPILVATGLGLLGWGIGAVAGHAIQGKCSGEFCEIEGIFYGGAAGGGLGLAVGAYLGNRRRGNFLLDVVASGAVWGLGYALLQSFARNGDDTGVALTLIVLPPTQLVATVITERATGRARARRARAP